MITTTSERGPQTEGTEQTTEAVPRPERRVRVPRPSRTASAPAAVQGLHIRWGRTAVALVGLLSLAIALVTLILAPFTAVAWTVPVFFALVGIGCFAALRYLAVTERRGRSGLTAPQAEEITAVEPAESRGHRSELFDLQQDTASAQEDSAETADVAPSAAEQASSSSHAASAGEQEAQERLPESIDAEEEAMDAREMLREQARRVASGKPVAFSPVRTDWQPVAVPRPTYLDAPEIRQETPAPEAQPQQPQSSSSTLAEAARKGEQQARGFDLDDVLSRRRA